MRKFLFIGVLAIVAFSGGCIPGCGFEPPGNQCDIALTEEEDPDGDCVPTDFDCRPAIAGENHDMREPGCSCDDHRKVVEENLGCNVVAVSPEDAGPDEPECTAVTWYQDQDGDGYGDDNAETSACDRPEGYVDRGGDACAPNDPDRHEDASEVCNGLDDDCDGEVDENATQEWYVDGDGDGYGAAGTIPAACNADELDDRFVDNNGDCDDGNDDRHPDNPEVPADGVDQDCDEKDLCYVDGDGDGFGTTATAVDPDADLDCATGAGVADNSQDFDDGNPNSYPGATEVCDGDDNDGDGEIDEGVKTTFCADLDDDGESDPDNCAAVCAGSQPVDFYALSERPHTDCDDADADLNHKDEDGDGNTTCGDSADEQDALAGDCDDEDGARENLDADGDGVTTCDDVPDCDDADPNRFPGNQEVCDGQENSCNGLVDDDDPDLVGGTTFYLDADGDGHGSDDQDDAKDFCADVPPQGYADTADDPSDNDPSVCPSSEDCPEICDGKDNDLNGLIDDGTGVLSTFYADKDEDTELDPDDTVQACAAPDGYHAFVPGVSVFDCVDNAFTGASFNHKDEDDDGNINCPVELDDGTVIPPDCDITDASKHFLDKDGDGFNTCQLVDGDCNDDPDQNGASQSPGLPELCSTGFDDDCDGEVNEDDASDAEIWCEDGDDDGVGNCADGELVRCTQPPSYVLKSAGTDCENNNEQVTPGKDELCSTDFDDNCDGLVNDESSADADAYMADADGDGFVNQSVVKNACEQPDGFEPEVTDPALNDCADDDGQINPDATEVCDGVDNDCDGLVDENDAEDAKTWCFDGDGDGFGDCNRDQAVACTPPQFYTDQVGDCDDANAQAAPNKDELCSTAFDDDCDGLVNDSSAADAETFYADADSDGFGDPDVTQQACLQPAGTSVDNTDCDDGDPALHPGDDDNDGVSTCEGDCDDANAQAKPGNDELCSTGFDDDCDGNVNEDTAADAEIWFADADGDGFGDPDTTEKSCTQPSGFVSDNTDCRDTDENANPDADENCATPYSDDCDLQVNEIDTDAQGNVTTIGAKVCHADSDGDGYGDPSDTQDACACPSGTVENGKDCDDTRADLNQDDADNDGFSTCDGDCLPETSAELTPEDADNDEFSSCEGDCDDNDPSKNLKDEDEDGLSTCGIACDADGDGQVDDICPDCDDNDDTVQTRTWCLDGDNDGYGFCDPDDLESTYEASCEQPDPLGGNENFQYRENDLDADTDDDCKDTDDGVFPGAPEDTQALCTDGVDNDCDGLTDQEDPDCPLP